jgi:dihydroxyacetone kinase phosphoprotein-dependent L subunit
VSSPGEVLPTERIIAWLSDFHRCVVADQRHLTDLDTAIGDGDHGANLARGMTAVAALLDADPPCAPDALLKEVAMTLVRTVGGASGPLLGTYLLRFAAALGPSPTVQTIGAALQAGADGVAARGRAAVGDKTMLDTLAPAAAGYAQAAEGGPASAVAAMLAAAERGRDSTVPLVARRGRASYLGERSVGHLDPGAASAAMLIRSAAQTWVT